VKKLSKPIYSKDIKLTQTYEGPYVMVNRGYPPYSCIFITTSLDDAITFAKGQKVIIKVINPDGSKFVINLNDKDSERLFLEYTGAKTDKEKDRILKRYTNE